MLKCVIWCLCGHAVVGVLGVQERAEDTALWCSRAATQCGESVTSHSHHLEAVCHYVLYVMGPALFHHVVSLCI